MYSNRSSAGTSYNLCQSHYDQYAAVLKANYTQLRDLSASGRTGTCGGCGFSGTYHGLATWNVSGSGCSHGKTSGHYYCATHSKDCGSSQTHT